VSRPSSSALPLELPSADEVIALGRAAEGQARADLVAAGFEHLALEQRPGGAPEQLRICLLVPRVDVGGGAKILLEHANRLHDRGHDVQVLAHFPRPDWFDLRAHYVHVPVGVELTAALAPCDLVVCGYWDQVAAARAAGVAPVVHFEQGDFHLFEDVPDALLARVQANMDAADATTTVSAQVAAVLGERYGLGDVGVVHNAVDGEIFHADGLRPEGPDYVLVVGWDGNDFKGMDEVRELWGRLRAQRPGLELVWVTPRAPRRPMGRVVVSPSQTRLAALFRGAAVYLCASRYESFPLPPLEAMACGAPVVTTANVGVLEYARHGDNARVVPIGDVDAMATEIGRILDEPELAASLRGGGARTAASFSWDQIIGELDDRYRALAGRQVARKAGAAWERLLPGATEAAPGAAARLELALATSGAREIAVPVARPAIDGHDVVSWEVIARRRTGRQGIARVHAPHRDAARGNLPWQAGLDALDAGRPQAALELFMDAFRRSEARATKGAVTKWVALCLLEVYRTEEAMDLLESAINAFPDNPDYTYLAALVAPMAGRPVDLSHAVANIALIGEATRYDDWLAAPASLLAGRQG
jgi:L-malate glycosyltransferase